METLTILIVDSNEDFREALSLAVQDQYRVYSSANGAEAFTLLKKYAPDILLLDLMLPDLDGISLLHNAAAAGIHPMVIATCRLINDYVINSSRNLGVSYLLEKPCNVHATADRIRDLSQQLHRSDAYAPDPVTHVSNMLLSLGISTKLRGYTYLREAVLLMADAPTQSITKELYPAVANKCNNTAIQVERSIRTAIEAAWEKRDEKIWMQFFQPDSDGKISRPSNGGFITRLSDHLLLDQMRFRLPE